MEILQEGLYGKKPPEGWWINQELTCECQCVFKLGKEDLPLRVNKFGPTRIGYLTFIVHCPKCRQEVRLDFDFLNPQRNLGGAG